MQKFPSCAHDMLLVMITSLYSTGNIFFSFVSQKDQGLYSFYKLPHCFMYTTKKMRVFFSNTLSSQEQHNQCGPLDIVNWRDHCGGDNQHLYPMQSLSIQSKTQSYYLDANICHKHVIKTTLTSRNNFLDDHSHFSLLY